MKISIQIFIILITIFIYINQVNSVIKENNIQKYFFYEKINNKNICIPNGFNKSNFIKNKTIQKRALSCEISAASDILSYLKGEKISEDILLNKLEKSEYNTLPKYKNENLSWGNPEEGFVGYIDKLPDGKTARQRKMTGYGVLEKPIEKIFNSYGFKTQVINKYDYTDTFNEKDHLELLLQEFKKGNMIQLWGDICTNPEFYSGKEHECYYAGKPSWNDDRIISWEYKDKNGNVIKYNGLNGEHAFYILGYKGTVNNPTDIIVWDTFTGEHTYPTSEWMRKWKKMQYRSIIIYSDKNTGK
ncbi:MAG: C39 family peptidase [Candidatus Gracilibacteria bacterium]|nr:C39 family peptidase [Candidatus Gracilibacteria bacterium]MDQ7023155.1 C39 family peptidase [Candidatus Gracilibacteria bacterium]